MTFALLAFSIIAFAFSSIVMMPGMKEPLFGRTDVPIERYVYQAPERRSVIVDGDGLAHPTADMTHATKRDRSRRIEKWAETPSLDVVSGETSAALSQTVSMSPRRVSAGRLVKEAIVTDLTLSRFARHTLHVQSSQGQVLVWGHVLDQREKELVLAIAEARAPGQVEAHLSLISE